jgi:branched-chain amino acid transport system substrate-binding protein
MTKKKEKSSKVVKNKGRRKVLKTLGSAALLAGASNFLPMPWVRKADASNHILIGIPSSLSTPYGVADDQDHLNGTIMAIEAINAKGGVQGREIKTFVPDYDKLSAESTQSAIAACIDKKVHAISNAFTFAPIPGMDTSTKWKAPYLQGNTQRLATEEFKKNPKKYSHVLQTDPSEVNYGWTYPMWLDAMKATGTWKPVNNKVHIISEQTGYNQTILKAAKESLAKSGWELAGDTQIQYPVNDWGPVIRELKKVGAGAIMCNHWMAAEEAAFCKQFRADPVPGALVYVQYGASQPEFLELGGRAMEGFCWSTVLGVYGDKIGQDFRKAYLKRFPEFGTYKKNTMGLVYTGNGYDIVNYLAASWNATGALGLNDADFKKNCDWIRTNPFRGVCGMMDMNNEYQEALHFPDNGFGNQSNSHETGMGQLFVQVQNVQHKIIWPNDYSESKLEGCDWW